MPHWTTPAALIYCVMLWLSRTGTAAIAGPCFDKQAGISKACFADSCAICLPLWANLTPLERCRLCEWRHSEVFGTWERTQPPLHLWHTEIVREVCALETGNCCTRQVDSNRLLRKKTTSSFSGVYVEETPLTYFKTPPRSVCFYFFTSLLFLVY